MKNVVESYSSYPIIKEIIKQVTKDGEKLNIKDLVGSSFALIGSAVRNSTREFNHLFILPDKEQAAYFANDLEELFAWIEKVVK